MERLSPFAKLAITMFAAIVGVSAVLGIVSALDDGRIGGGEDDAVDEGFDDAVVGDVLVSAAASLTDVFGALEVAFEREFPGSDVVLNLGGSSTLAEQVALGAPVDVIATADPRVMAGLDADGLLDTPPEAFASSQLVLAFPAGNPAGITGLADLADPDLLVGLCAGAQPCGRYAREALATAGLDGDEVADTAEPDVRALLARIRAGELDAGIVYATDAVAVGDEVQTLPLDGPTASWEVAVVVDAPDVLAADAFVAFLLGPTGTAVLREAGFGPPVAAVADDGP